MLAPDLFCRAIDWLMSRVKPGGNLGIRVGQNMFDDLDYTDDGALLPSDRTLMTALLQRFDLTRRQATWASTFHGPRRRSRMWAMVVHAQLFLS